MRLHSLYLQCVVVLMACVPCQGQSTGGAEARVSLERHSGPAQVVAISLGKHSLRLDVDRRGEAGPLTLRVELPVSGPKTWPVSDVEVRDAAGRAMLVRRSGIEWEKLLIPLLDDVSSCQVRAVEPAGGWPRTRAEKDRMIQDATSGARARIANWPQGRAAALSIRFDDSHPTHLSKAVPILREYGFKGTFMVNPGPKEPGSRQNYAFETQHAEWEALMKQGDMELANHSAHHRGAKGDEDMEREIGGAAEAIWKLMPGRNRLLALNLGGGTWWETKRTLRHYLDKYHHFDASSGSLGMDDSYGGRVEAFRRALQSHLERGLWCRVHYHYIGEGLSSSEANFRAALDIAKAHQDKLWIAGMADIHKYQAERAAARLKLVKSDAESLAFQLECSTDAALYDHPLTLEVAPPAAWAPERTSVRSQDGRAIAAQSFTDDGVAWLRFELPPRTSGCLVTTRP